MLELCTETDVAFQMKCQFLLCHINQNWNVVINLSELSSIKFNKNMLCGSRVVTRGEDRQI
jgi:hypothetical protein